MREHHLASIAERLVSRHAAVAALLLACLAGCSPSAPTSPNVTAAAPATDTVATTSVPSPSRLPVSLNDVMVALVNQAADPLWVAAWKGPQSDDDWRRLEHMAYQLDIAGALIRTPGTGPLDETWTRDPAWQEFAGRLTAIGKRAIDAVQARDIEEIAATGDELVEICEACHLAFRPDVPTGGRYGDVAPAELRRPAEDATAVPTTSTAPGS